MLRNAIKIFVVYIFLFAHVCAQDYFWQKTDKLEGGVVYSLLVQNDTLIIGTKGGVYISENFGKIWQPIGLNSFEVWDISFCEDYIVAISSGGCYRKKVADVEWVKIKEGRYQTIETKDSLIYLGSGYQGIYRSKDCGQTWEQINNGIDNRDIEKIHITSSNIILASAAGTSGSGVFRSLDFGDSWSRIDPYQYAWNFEGITEFDSVLYAFDFNNNAKVYKSVDDGLTWFLPSGSHAPSDIINSIYADSDGIYVGVYHYGFFRSANEGASWSKINTGLKNLTISDIDGNSTELFLATFDGFYKSYKNAMNWMRYMNGISSANIYSLSQNSDYLFVGTSGSGLFRATKDLSNWQEMDLGNNNKFVTSILALENNVFVLVSSWTNHYYEELFVSTNNGASWRKLNPNLDAGQLETIVGNNNVLFIGSDYGVFRSINSGNNWEKMSNGMPNNINSASIAVYDSIVVVTNGTSGIYRSDDLGDSWTYNSVPDLFSGKAVSVSADGVFYLGSGSVNKLFKSEDLGLTWLQLNNPLYNSAVNSIGIEGNFIYCGLSNNGVIMSSDGGETWVESNFGLASRKVQCISISNNKHFVGTSSGLYKEITSAITPIIDYGKELNQNSISLRWKITPGITEYRIQISTDSTFRTLLVDQVISDTSYHANNLNFMTTYYWRISTVTDYWNEKFSPIQKIVIANPMNYKLYNNYPNPFNNETNIRIDVPYSSEIKLVLFNILGKRVKTIEKSFVEAGSYYYKLESNNLASGIYLLRLVGDNYSKTLKIVLLR